MIRVLLVDDQELVRSGFRIILESEPDIEVVGEARDGVEAVRLSGELSPDVICMDVEMPEMNGIEASRRIIGGVDAGGGSGSGSGGVPSILILTTFGHEQYLFDALAAGVSGFLLKTSRAEQLIDAVHTLAGGNALLGADVTRAVIEQVRGGGAGGDATLTADVAGRAGGAAGDPAGEPAADAAAGAAVGAVVGAVDVAMEAAGLTERERDVLALMARGWSNAEVAAELFLGEATVKTHVSNVLQKLGVRDRIQAVVWVHTRE